MESNQSLARPSVRARMLKHGHKTATLRNGTKEYRAWHDMKARCRNHNNPAFRMYGGRGVTVCDRWLSDFTAFLTDMGTAPHGTSLDRIDPAGNYEPSNCRWATVAVQARNTRRRPLTLPDGMTAREFAIRERVDPKALRRRLLLGEDHVSALARIKANRPKRWTAA